MSTSVGSGKRQKVVLDHDGGVDDLVALTLLAGNPELVELLGVVIVDADCLIDEAAEASAKVLAALHHHSKGTIPKINIGKSSCKAVHPFPAEWRHLSCNMKSFPCVNTAASADWKSHIVADKPGEELLAEWVLQSGPNNEKVTIVVTGPLSNVAYCIKKYGDAFTSRLEAVVFMGGAVDVKGNVHAAGHDRFAPGTDDTQEWNLYWDAPAAREVVASSGIQKKVMFALDATNDVPITPEFVFRFGSQNQHFMSQFVGSSYALTTHWSLAYHRPYYAWDVLTVAWVFNAALVEKLEECSLAVEATLGHPSEGRSYRVGELAGAKEGSGIVLVARKPNPQVFYDEVLRLCQTV
jgi:purine nucleosidase